MATLSYSRINKFISKHACQMEHYWTYVLGKWPEQNAYMAKGTAVHEAIAANFRHKAEHQEDLPFGRLLQIFTDTWDREAAETDFTEDEIPAEIVRTTSEALEIWHRETAPLYVVPEDLRPDGKLPIEWKWYVELPAFAHDLKGKIDLIAHRLDKPGGEIQYRNVLVDWKTGKKAPDLLDLAGDFQPTIYVIACKAEWGEDWNPGAIFYEHIIDAGVGKPITDAKPADWNIAGAEMKNWLEKYGPNGSSKAKKPPAAPRRVDHTKVERTDADIKWLAVVLEQVCRQIDSGIHIPVAPGHWKCNAERCPHWSYCRGEITNPPAPEEEQTK